MKIPAMIRKESRAPMAWAAILTFIAWNAFGFGWFGLPTRIHRMDWADRTKGRGNAGKTPNSFFHPSGPSEFGYLIQRKSLILRSKLTRGAGRTPFHPVNPGPSLGFVTAGSAEQLATAKMEKVAVPLAAQLCATKFNAQASTIVSAKREKLQVAHYTHARGEQLEKAWIILGDDKYENQKVIDACAELILASEARKSAVLQK